MSKKKGKHYSKEEATDSIPGILMTELVIPLVVAGAMGVTLCVAFPLSIVAAVGALSGIHAGYTAIKDATAPKESTSISTPAAQKHTEAAQAFQSNESMIATLFNNNKGDLNAQMSVGDNGNYVISVGAPTPELA